MDLKKGMKFIIKYYSIPGYMIEIREIREKDVRAFILNPYGGRSSEGRIIPLKAFDKNDFYELMEEDDGVGENT